MKYREIRSLKDLKKRKYLIRRKTQKYELWMGEDIQTLAHPIVNNRYMYNRNGYDGEPTPVIYKIIRNIKRGIDIFRLGSAIFFDFKR